MKNGNLSLKQIIYTYLFSKVKFSQIEFHLKKTPNELRHRDKRNLISRSTSYRSEKSEKKKSKTILKQFFAARRNNRKKNKRFVKNIYFFFLVNIKKDIIFETLNSANLAAGKLRKTECKRSCRHIASISSSIKE